MFARLIEDQRDTKHRCTIYRRSDPPEIEQWLDSHGVAIESRPLPPMKPDPFIEISVNDEVVGVIAIETVEALLESPIVKPGERDEISEGYRALFDILEKTVVSGMSRREFLAVSREIEDRAFRIGEGTLRVNFQTLSAFKSQTDVYKTLATETDLKIHIYGVDDWTPPTITGITYHTKGADRFQPYWVLSYDGGIDDTQACGLVAEELMDGYTGFWTNDPPIVEQIAATLHAI